MLVATWLVIGSLRSKPVLTAVGKVEFSRPYYLCSHCHVGQFPADVDLDIENTEFSPGVRRMQAVVGQEAAFDHGRQQVKLLADLEVTTKAVERTAEAIGEDIAAREQEEIERAMQLDLPLIVGELIRFLYVQLDGTGVSVVKKKLWVGRARRQDNRPTRGRPSWDVCLRKRPGTRKATPSATPIRPLTWARLKLRRNLESGSIWKLGSAVGTVPKRRS